MNRSTVSKKAEDINSFVIGYERPYVTGFAKAIPNHTITEI